MEKEIDGITIKEENGVVSYVGGAPSTLEITEHDGYISYTGDDSDGGSGGLEILAEAERNNVQHTGTSYTKLMDIPYTGNISIGDVLMLQVKRKGGMEANNFFGANEVLNIIGETTSGTYRFSYGLTTIYGVTGGSLGSSSNVNTAGIFVGTIRKAEKTVEIGIRYDAGTTKTINGDFEIKLYKLFSI